MEKKYSLKPCNCQNVDQCELFQRIQKAFDSLPKESIPSAIFNRVTFSVLQDGWCLYTLRNSLGGSENPAEAEESELLVVFTCRVLLDHTVKQLQILMVRAFCDIAAEEAEPYLAFLFERKKFFRSGFECGSSGKIPRLEFDAEQEEQAYNEGYSKGQIAALVRAANKFLTS